MKADTLLDVFFLFKFFLQRIAYQFCNFVKREMIC
jgi:hypothetical protein